MRPPPTFGLALALSSALACHPAPGPSTPATGSDAVEVEGPAGPRVDAQAMLQSISWLASDQREGRHTLTPQIHEVASWLADSYELLHLEPVGESLILPYQLRTRVGAGALQRLVIHAKSGKSTTTLTSADFVPLSEGHAGEVRGELVFVGYGVQWDRKHQAELFAQLPGAANVDTNATIVESYDDLAGVDVRGKIALVLAHAPTRPDLVALHNAARTLAEDFEIEAAPLREAGDREALVALHAKIRQALVERGELTIDLRELDAGFWAVDDPMAGLDHERLYTMLLAVAAHVPRFSLADTRLAPKLERLHAAGAVGAIVVNGPSSYVTREGREADELPVLERDNADSTVVHEHAPFPVVQLRWKQAEKLLRIEGKRLSRVQAAIDTDFMPRSASLGVDVELATSFVETFVEVPNVVAKIQGRSDEVVLIGAHFDHIGKVGFGSCRANPGDTICNGADDNASGTAMILDIARAFRATGLTPERTVVFAHFSGEELGLLGSKAFIEDPPFDQSKIVAMVNLDMVGRLGERGLAIGSLATSDQWLPLLESLGDRGMTLLLDRSTTTRSDHRWWFRRQIPVLFLFTGEHEDYHRGTDELAKIEPGGLASIGQLTADLVWALAQGYPMSWGDLAPGEGISSRLPGDDPSSVVSF